MADFPMRVNKNNGQMVMPAPLRRTWGERYILTDNAFTGVIYPEGTSPQTILASLDTLKRHFNQIVSMSKESAGSSVEE